MSFLWFCLINFRVVEFNKKIKIINFMTIIRLVNTLIAFNIGYWSFYLLVSFFYNVNKLTILVIYLIIGLFIGIISTRRKGSKQSREWSKLMEKIDKKSKPRYEVIFYRAIAWPLSLFISAKRFLRK